MVYLDGATGSNLMKRGMPAGVCPEEWILENPDVLIGLQKEYVEAGSNIIYAPTFTANRIKLKEYGLEEQIEEFNERLVGLSLKAAAGRALVAGDITMTGRSLAPMGDMDFEELVQVYKEQIRYLDKAGVDLLVVETMMSLQESRAALIAAKEVCSLPVMVTLTFEADGRTLYGTDGVSAAVVLEKLGADALGANCSTGPDKMIELIRQIAETVSVPVIAKPNAGMPSLNEQGETVYDMDPETFAREMAGIVDAGATILGGCCGTSPEYIKKLVKVTSNMEVRRQMKKGLHYLTSERKTICFDLDSPFMVIGERINPTGKKKLQTELKEGKLDLVLSFAEEQEICGAALLDINLGMSGIDEKEMMLKALDEVTVSVNLPLSIDSSHVEVIEAALRRYPGRALINSISGEEEKLKKLLPIAQKYGAMFILGMQKEDIIVDGLAATVGANPNAAKEVLETIRYCKERGLCTVCGLSNISFGLPERSFVNTAFLTMAIKEGLTMAIANPSQELLMNIAYASDLLMCKEGGDIRYIDHMAQYQERKPIMVPAAVPGDRGKAHAVPEEMPDHTQSPAKGQIYQDVLKGSRKQITEHVREAVAGGRKADAILNEFLLPAINEVGELFDKGNYFLPQLIASAETMKLAIEYLEPLLVREQQFGEMPVVVIATVQGDIHDIGKNLVALMLKNYGFQIVDLGKDVPAEVIVEEAIKREARIIALSALMTTTMQEMKHVVTCAKEKGVKAKIMIGGAVITEDYALEIGADGYSRDAADAVKVAKRLIGELKDRT